VSKPNEKSLELILSHVTRSDNGCLEWNRSVNRKGYGIIKIMGKIYRPHRIIWEMHNGPIPDGMMICHTCDNPPCCEISHLYIGTNQDNVDDRSRRGRGAKKLTAEKAAKIRIDSRSRREIATEYGISMLAVTHIKKFRWWRYV